MTFPLLFLLATSFSCIGLISLWAATSSVHWFVRAASLLFVVVLFGMLTSAGPLALFGLQSVIILAAINAKRFWTWRRRKAAETAARFSWRFSLIDSLFATVAAAILAAVLAAIVRRPARPVDEYEAIEWPVLCLGGIGFAVVTLMAARSSRHWRRLVRGLVAIIPVAIGLGFGIQWLEPAFAEILQSEFKDPFSTDASTPWYAWAVLGVATWFITTVVCFLGVRSDGSYRQRRTRWIAQVSWMLIAAYPAYVYILLMFPPQAPVIEVPRPNGFDDVALAGKALDVRLINLASESPLDQVAAEVKRLQEHFDRGEQGLRTACVLPLKYSMDDIDVDFFSANRTLGRAFSARSRVAISEGRLDDAVRDFHNMLMLASLLDSEGLAIHYFLASAIEGMAHDDIWKSRHQLNREQCQRLIDALEAAKNSQEVVDVILQRERIWTANATGMYSHLSIILADFQDGIWIEKAIREETWPQRRAERELLIAELAILAFRLEHGRLPQELSELTPSFLNAVPSDPFDPHGDPLRYRLTEEGFELYSVGLNRIDDDGVAIEDHETPGHPRRGDYRLDAVFSDRK